MPTSGTMTVNHEDVMALAGQIANEGTALGELLSRLTSQIDSCTSANWVGAGSSAFVAASAQWNASATNLMQILEDIGKLVSSAAGVYQETDSTISNSFHV